MGILTGFSQSVSQLGYGRWMELITNDDERSYEVTEYKINK